jgi:hypothetical protein
MSLVLRNSFLKNVFELMGKDENSATYALGWALERSPCFATLFVSEIAGAKMPFNEVRISLQKSGDDRGFTDIELRCGDDFHAIIEAKQGFELPTESQLLRYRPRLDKSSANLQRVISISALTSQIAERTLPAEIKGVPVKHKSWGFVRGIAKQAKQQASSTEEKIWLRELIHHLEEYAAMNRARDNLVYVVSLGGNSMHAGTDRTWIDVVEKDACYFHPVGNHWPNQPPNYIGFRYRGQLQSVHRIESYEIFTDISDVNPTWVPTNVDHFVYKLGPAMKPPKPLRAGGPDDAIKRSARVWCAIDTLLSGEFAQLGDARDETNRRAKAAEDLND